MASKFQPKFKDQTGLTGAFRFGPPSPEFGDALASPTNGGYTTYKYPSDIENTMSNVMLFMFNSIEDDLEIKGTVAGLPLNWDDLVGAVVGEVPIRNRAYQALHQQGELDKIIGAINKIDKLNLAGLKMRKYKRINRAALLPMPTVQVSSNARWQDIDVTSAVGMLANIMLSDKSGGDKLVDTMRDMGTGFMHFGIDKATGTEGLGSALTKSVGNSYQDQAFQGMTRRQFRFIWNLAPKNQKEMDNLQQLIALFRFHAHPSFYVDQNNSGNYLVFPEQIDVEMYTKDENDSFIQNGWVPKISSSVIESVEIDYAPNNQWSFIKNAGAPTHYTLTVAIKEVLPLTKADIARGF
jgi:hypothetical protein